MKELHDLSVAVSIGKNGLTPAILDEVKLHLKKARRIKIKFLKSAIEGEKRIALAKKLAEGANAVLLARVGGACILGRKGKSI